MPKRLTSKQIQEQLKYLPNTKGYIILSKYKNENTPLWWRYIDKNYKIHYFLMDWNHFKNAGSRFPNTLLSRRDLVQEVYDKIGNKYSVLSLKYDGNTQKYYLLLRHNSINCNYYTYWVNIYSFLKSGLRCKVCQHKKLANMQRLTKNEIYKQIFSQYDNKNHRYIPDLTHYKRNNQLLYWTEYHSNGNITHFYMSLYGFRKGDRPDNKQSKNESYFNYLLNDKCKLKENKDYFYSYKLSSHHKYHRGYDFSFDFYFPKYKYNHYKGLVVEVDGLQHIIPVNWSGHLSHQKINELFHYQKLRDKNKNKYCKNHNLYLLRIPCYYFSSITHKWMDDSQKLVKKSIKNSFYNKFLPLTYNILKN